MPVCIDKFMALQCAKKPGASGFCAYVSGWYNTPRDLHDSSYDTKAEFNNIVLLFIQNNS